jgi:hypothetical protein
MARAPFFLRTLSFPQFACLTTQQENMSIRPHTLALTLLFSLAITTGCTQSRFTAAEKTEAFAERIEVRDYLERLFEIGKPNPRTLAYVEQFSGSVSSNPDNVASFHELLEKAKKTKKTDDFRALVVQMAKLVELSGRWQSRLATEADPQPDGSYQ